MSNRLCEALKFVSGYCHEEHVTKSTFEKCPHPACRAARVALAASGEQTREVPLCAHCGKPESDSKHIRYGNDVDNPVKHVFKPLAKAGETSGEWDRLLDEVAEHVMPLSGACKNSIVFELRSRLSPYLAATREVPNSHTYHYTPDVPLAKAEAALAESGAGQLDNAAQWNEASERMRKLTQQYEQAKDPVGCGCDEFPECTHSLYWHMGHKAALAQTVPAKEKEVPVRINPHRAGSHDAVTSGEQTREVPLDPKIVSPDNHALNERLAGAKAEETSGEWDALRKEIAMLQAREELFPPDSIPCAMVRRRDVIAVIDAAAPELSARQQVCNEIMEIMKEHDRQWPNVDTPGGLEHMGDVWSKLGKWNALLRKAGGK